ncbi:MAG TPA: hypothetical protein VOA41_07775 [Candidatus Dormibacteraeota bacterium]|nr:hypothetical protein [Candidatus Dormibacteraeota bacterium]
MSAKQQPGRDGIDQSRPAAAVRKSPTTQVTHRFWDRQNAWWFAGVGTSRALDYSSTLNMRRRGRQEILLNNEIVDNHPLFAGVEAAGTVASMGVSYLFHRTGHHRLERLTSIIHVGVTTAGAIRNYSLVTAYPAGASR